MTTFAPAEIRYIKLGEGGRWAAAAFETGAIPFGYPAAEHAACAAGDWDLVREQLAGVRDKPFAVNQDLREVQDFYLLGTDTLWVTMAMGHLWWAFADGPVVATQEVGPETATRHRLTRDGWHRESLTGVPLTLRGLSSVLTRTANYQRTICKVDASAYLLRRIRGQANPLHVQAIELQGQLRAVAERMIQQLHWAEFETLVDLIFARGGWRRTSVLGAGMPDVDLVLDQPVSGETAWVQVKSGTRQAELDDSLEEFRRDGSCDRFYFVCHSQKGQLRLPHGPGLHLWTGTVLADAAIDVGLFSWLIDRTR